MFVDKVDVQVKAGKGGNGVVSFRHERYIAKGGPNGGDGGKGGDVVLQASRNQNTLASFRYKKLLKAKNGADGEQNRKAGRSAEDLIVSVPVGTVVLDEKGKIIADLNDDGLIKIIAKGGKGGFGNAHFKSSVRQAPRIAELGEVGEEFNLTLELKIIADVGLIGLPNAGKSSFLAAVSNARPEIADYPFTTLEPNLGVCDINNDSLLIADIPGLIEGAAQGKGLGDDFLRHISRCKVLLHLIDVNSPDIIKDYQTIREELVAYSKLIARKTEVVAITKIETVDSAKLDEQHDKLQSVLPAKIQIFKISSFANKNTDSLLYELFKIVEKAAKASAKRKSSRLPVITLEPDVRHWTVKKTKDGFVVRGVKIEKFAAKTDFNSEAGIRRLKDIMKKMGIMRELTRKGIKPGDTIRIGIVGSKIITL